MIFQISAWVLICQPGSELCVVCSFRLVPFLTELRAVMDWVWTDTSLSLSSWICVEDIYAHIFILKCWRESEKVWWAPLWVPVSWEFKTESYYYFFWKWLAVFKGCPPTSCFNITISHVCGDLCSLHLNMFVQCLTGLSKLGPPVLKILVPNRHESGVQQQRRSRASLTSLISFVRRGTPSREARRRRKWWSTGWEGWLWCCWSASCGSRFSSCPS